MNGIENANWPQERHAVPDWIRENEPLPSGSFAYMVDQARVPAGASSAPIAAIVGCFLIGADGRATGAFLRNVEYVPDGDDITLLQSPDLHVEWLGGPPGLAVRQTLEELLSGQLPGARVRHVHVVDHPRTRLRTTPVDIPAKGWPLGLSRRDKSLQTVMLTDAAVAMAITVWASDPFGRPQLLHGVLTIVHTGLDGDNRGASAWLEREPTLDDAEKLLQQRIAQVRAAT